MRVGVVLRTLVTWVPPRACRVARPSGPLRLQSRPRCRLKQAEGVGQTHRTSQRITQCSIYGVDMISTSSLHLPFSCHPVLCSVQSSCSHQLEEFTVRREADAISVMPARINSPCSVPCNANYDLGCSHVSAFLHNSRLRWTNVLHVACRWKLLSHSSVFCFCSNVFSLRCHTLHCQVGFNTPHRKCRLFRALNQTAKRCHSICHVASATWSLQALHKLFVWACRIQCGLRCLFFSAWF